MANKPLILNDGIVLNNETLTQYDEGTWTPTILASTGGDGATYISRAAHYTRIGNVVHCQFYVSISAHTGSGTMSVGGLPFVSKNVSNLYAHTATLDFSNLSVPAGSIPTAIIAPNSQALLLLTYTPGAASTALLALDTAFSLYGTFTYLI